MRPAQIPPRIDRQRFPAATRCTPPGRKERAWHRRRPGRAKDRPRMANRPPGQGSLPTHGGLLLARGRGDLPSLRSLPAWSRDHKARWRDHPARLRSLPNWLRDHKARGRSHPASMWFDPAGPTSHLLRGGNDKSAGGFDPAGGESLTPWLRYYAKGLLSYGCQALQDPDRNEFIS